jgi:hypothetical protein
MTMEISDVRLYQHHHRAAQQPAVMTRDVDQLRARVAALEAQQRAWLECALYDATMAGPVFKGWNRSALDRLRIQAEKIEK